jgi:hypothetical protein
MSSICNVLFYNEKSIVHSLSHKIYEVFVLDYRRLYSLASETMSLHDESHIDISELTAFRRTTFLCSFRPEMRNPRPGVAFYLAHMKFYNFNTLFH